MAPGRPEFSLDHGCYPRDSMRYSRVYIRSDKTLCEQKENRKLVGELWKVSTEELSTKSGIRRVGWSRSLS